MGQELTIRTYHTGVTRKRILPVELVEGGVEQEFERADESVEIKTGMDVPESQSEIRNEKGRKVGRFGGGVGNIGLALLRLEAVGKGEQKMSMVGGIGVKAIKPSWW